MATNDSKAPLRQVKRVQFGILSPDEIVSFILSHWILFWICYERFHKYLIAAPYVCDRGWRPIRRNYGRWSS